MNNIVLSLWKRKFDLEVIYDVYENEEILDIQKEIFDNFEKDISNNIEVMEKAKQGIIKYILSKNANDLKEDNITNLFKYIIPTSIFIERNGIADIMCEYKFDPEHGIAVRFEKQQFKDVVSQDIVI